MNTQQLMDHLAGQDAERLLLAAHDAGGRPTAAELATVLEEDHGYVLTLTKELIQLGLVEAEQSQANEVAPTPAGSAVAAKIRKSFVNGPRRTDAVRRGVLQPLSEGRRIWSHELAADWPWAPLEPAPTETEIQQAMTYLQDAGLIKTQGTWGGPTMAILITSAGMDALQSSRLLVSGQSAGSNLFDQRDQSMTVHQSHGTFGSVSRGDHNTVNTTIVVAAEQAHQIRDLLQQALRHAADLPEAQRDPVRQALDEALAQATAEAPQPGPLRHGVDKAMSAAVTAVGTSAGQAIVSLLAGIPPLL